MKLKTLIAASAATITLSVPAFADIMITDGYARASSPLAKSGAAFFTIHNSGDADDHLISVTSDVAKRTELHTHLENEMGVMKMLHAEDGFVILSGAKTFLERGGKHVMFMGLNAPFVDGEDVTFTLTFRDAGEIEVTVPVDLTRQPNAGMDNETMNHGEMDHSNH